MESTMGAMTGSKRPGEVMEAGNPKKHKSISANTAGEISGILETERSAKDAKSIDELYELKIKILDAQRKRSKTTKQGIEAVSAAFAEREKVEKVTAEKTAEAQRHVDGVNTAEARLKLITTRHGGMFATCEAASKYWEVVSDARAADLDAEQEVKVLKSRLGKLEEELVESALAVFDTKVRLALEELRLKFDNVGGLAAGYGKIQLKAVLYDAFRRVKEM